MRNLVFLILNLLAPITPLSSSSHSNNLSAPIFPSVYNLSSQLKRETISPVDIINLFSEYITPLGEGVSEKCNDASSHYLLEILNANPRALKMLDASAKVPPAGMLTNTILHHPGSFSSCLEVASEDLNAQHCLLTSYYRGYGIMGPAARQQGGSDGQNSKHHHLQTKIPPLPPRLNRDWDDNFQPLEGLGLLLGLGAWKLGRCVPSACSEEDVAQGLRNFMEEALGPLLGGDAITGVSLMEPFDVVSLNCHTKEEEIKLEAGDWAMIAVISAFVILVTIGTVVDVTLNILNLDNIFSEKVVRLFQGFSIYTNTLKLFHCPESGSSGSLDCINGIRFISMTWVVLGHGYSQFMGTGPFVSNLMTVFDPDGSFLGSGAFAAIINALPSVDSFFLIGATLLSYITLKELDKNNGGSAKFWTMYYVHRYIRLTGLYAIIVGLHATLLKFFATGVQSYLVDSNVEVCQDTWYFNLLYLNNIHWVSSKNLYCVGVTWYMANDMQFFLTTPFIIWALRKNRVLGCSVLGSLLVIFTIIPTVLGYINDWPFSSIILAGGSPAQNWNYEFYVVPWCRFQPYLVGLGLGYLLHKTRDLQKLPLNPVSVTWLWAMAVLMGTLVIYGLVPYQKDPTMEASTMTRALYGGLHRLVWALALSWVILACVKGVGGPANSILSWPTWVPLARLSYCIYLIHITVMSIVNSYASYRVKISHPLIIYYNIFVLALSVALAYALSMLFEAPLVHLEKILYWAIGLKELPQVRRIKAE